MLENILLLATEIQKILNSQAVAEIQDLKELRLLFSNEYLPRQWVLRGCSQEGVSTEKANINCHALHMHSLAPC